MPRHSVQTEGSPEWKPLGSFSEFASELNAVPPPIVPPPSAVASRASNKIPAGICGILLGSLGIHKFILGYTGAGLVMLLVTILTCGIAGGGDCTSSASSKASFTCASPTRSLCEFTWTGARNGFKGSG